MLCSGVRDGQYIYEAIIFFIPWYLHFVIRKFHSQVVSLFFLYTPIYPFARNSSHSANRILASISSIKPDDPFFSSCRLGPPYIRCIHPVLPLQWTRRSHASNPVLNHIRECRLKLKEVCLPWGYEPSWRVGLMNSNMSKSNSVNAWV